MNNWNKLRSIFILICILLVVQISWWIIFNHTQNTTILKQKLRELDLRETVINSLPDSIINEKSITMLGLKKDKMSIQIDQTYLEMLHDETNRKNLMFVSESIFVLLLVIFGIFIVYRSFKYEIQMADQQQNFLLSITHELKTPISTVRLLLQTLKKKNLTEEKKETFISDSLLELDRLNDLVSNVIITTKAESKIKPQQIVRINLKQFIENQLELYQRYPKVSLILQIDSNLYVDMNEDDLHIVISNIINNAIHYTKKDPCIISIETKEIKNTIKLIISDNGIGILESELENIFKRFYRIGSETTRQYSGTGIGLYIVKLILNKYNASINCESDGINGSQFILTFPKGR